jgi:hypothetical protein
MNASIRIYIAEKMDNILNKRKTLFFNGLMSNALDQKVEMIHLILKKSQVNMKY